MVSQFYIIEITALFLHLNNNVYREFCIAFNANGFGRIAVTDLKRHITGTITDT